MESATVGGVRASEPRQTSDNLLRSSGITGLDKAICAYLLAPVALFCLWLQPAALAVVLGLTSVGAWWALGARKANESGISPRWWIAIVSISLFWTALAGAGHVFYANLDWLIRDAVLHDLSTAEWPATYHPESREPLLLRAPIAYYLPAASIGQWLGVGAANWALYAWTTAGVALVLAGACSLFATPKERVGCIVLLMLFGGLDLLGYVWGERHLPQLGEHIEWWMLYIQYSSNSTLLFWVPNHALPAWLGTLLVLRHWGKPEFATLVPLVSSAIPLWSPLAAIGLFPLFAFAIAWRRDWRLLLSPRSSLPFLPVALFVALYLSADASSVPHGWMIDTAQSIPAFAIRYVLFCLLEFGLLALILARAEVATSPFRVSILVLLALPFYYYGGGNDLAMRASIPALMVLALAAVAPLFQTPKIPGRAMLIGVLALGMLGAAQEPMRALLHPAWKPMPNSIPQAVAMWDSSIEDRYPAHYFAQPDRSPIGWLLRDSTPIEVADKVTGR